MVIKCIYTSHISFICFNNWIWKLATWHIFFIKTSKMPCKRICFLKRNMEFQLSLFLNTFRLKQQCFLNVFTEISFKRPNFWFFIWIIFLLASAVFQKFWVILSFMWKETNLKKKKQCFLFSQCFFQSRVIYVIEKE